MRKHWTLALALFAFGCSGNSAPLGGGGKPDLGSAHPDLSTGGNKLPDLAVAIDLTVAPDLTPPPPDLSLPQGATDLALGPPAGDLGIACGNLVCTSGQLCCATIANMMASTDCAATCANGQVPIACDGPESCGGNPCCGQVTSGALSAVACTASPTDCAPSIDIQTQTGMDRLCHADNDCGDGMPGISVFGLNFPLNQCCTIMNNGLSTHLCLNSTVLMYAGMLGVPITGHCP